MKSGNLRDVTESGEGGGSPQPALRGGRGALKEPAGRGRLLCVHPAAAGCRMKKNSPQTWSEEEDRVLSRWVTRAPPPRKLPSTDLVGLCAARRIILGLETLESISWKDVATHIPGRRGKQCRERWYNHLRPNIRSGPWEEEEEVNLITAHRIHGNKWAKISQFIDGRTENNVKNHW